VWFRIKEIVMKTVQKVLTVGLAITVVSFLASALLPVFPAVFASLGKLVGLSTSCGWCFGCLIPVAFGAFVLLKMRKKH
jgi:hypothetical protein